jgi:hypothetical protein
MPVTVERVPNEPIIIAHLWGIVDVSCVREMYTNSAPLVDEIGTHTYRVTDAREVETTFSDLVQILGKTMAGEPGSTGDPRITPILVGTNAWVKMLQESLKQQQYGAKQIAIYETREEALAHARALIAEQTASA